MSNTILIENAVVLTTDKTLNPGYISIKDNLINQVKTEPFEADERKQADTVIDAQGSYVLPGFINTHTHAGMSLFRSYADDMALMDWLKNKIWPAEDKLTADKVYWGSMLSILEMIKSGTTTFADMYFYMEDVAKAVDESGIRASLSRGMIGFKGEHSLSEAKEFVQNWNGQAEGRITCMLGPHAPYTCPPDFLDKSASLSEELDIPIHIHVSETEGEVADNYKEHGKSPVEHLNDLGVLARPVLAAHCVHVNDSDLDILHEKNVAISHNIGSNLKLGSGVAPIDKMLNSGLTVALGTDGASSNNNLDMLEEARLSSLVQKGVNQDPVLIHAKSAFEMATCKGGKALHMDGLGKIEPGYKADLTIIDKNSPELYPRHDPIANLIYSCNSKNTSTVIINGKVIMKNGEIQTFDEEKVYYEADKCAKMITEQN